MRGWGLFFFLFFLFLIFSIVGWVTYSFYSHRKQGIPPPSLKNWRTYIPFMKSGGSSTNYPTPRSSGPLEWIRDQIDKLRNKRTAPGAYEETSGEGAGGYRSAGGRGGRGAEDDAWDTRVGGEEDQYRYAGYEEQELGLAPTQGLQNEPYGGASEHTGARGQQDARGRRGPDPFGDQNEAESLRSVSPRPHEGHTRGQPSVESAGSGDSASPTGTRKSAFREGI